MPNYFLNPDEYVDGLQHHGSGFLFSFLLHFLSMFTRFVEALLEFSQRHWTYICDVYLTWFRVILGSMLQKKKN